MIKKLFKSLFLILIDKKNAEILTIALFMILNLFILRLKIYLLLIAVTWLVLFWLNQSLLKSTWMLFIATFLFGRAKFFPQKMSMLKLPAGFYEVEEKSIIFNYFIAFSDGILILLILFTHRLKDKLKKQASINILPAKILFIIFLIIAIIASYNSIFTGQSLFSVLQLIKYFSIFLITQNLTRNQKFTHSFLKIISVFLLINTILIVLQKLMGSTIGFVTEINPWSVYGRFADENSGLFRPGGFTADPNLIASIYSIFIPLLILIKNKKSKPMSLYSVTAQISFVGLFLTGSRLAILTTFLHSLIIFFFFYKNKSYKRGFLRILALITAVLMPLLIPRFATLRTTITGSGGLYRWRHLIIAKNYALENFWGIGLNVFQFKILQDYKPQFYLYDSTPPHNIFAQVAASTGLVGLIVFSCLLFFIFRYKFKNIKYSNFSLATLHGMVAFLVVANFYPWLLKSPISELFWIISGIGMIKERS